MRAQVDPAEFRGVELRCHSLLRDVPLHDVWAITLPGGGPDRTMQDVLAVAPFGDRRSPDVRVRALFALRRGLGQLFRWDEERHAQSAGSYIGRLTPDDRDRSLVPPGTRQGSFRLVYLLPREALAEVRNATVHAFLASALVPEPDGYLLYWAVYVRPVSALTGLYMTLIDPFRRWVVYPRMMRDMQAAWSQAYG